MQESSSEKRVRLTVRAHDSLSEVFLVNSQFQLREIGVGQLETPVLPGLYKARFRIGQQQVDQLIEVQPGSDAVEIQGLPVDFSSPVPFSGISTERRAHRKAAEELSRSVSEKKGKGAWLFLFIRALTDAETVPWAGFSLHDLDGTVLAEPSLGICNQHEGFFALHIEVDPGTYRLRVEEEPGEVYEIYVQAVAGWQTQVFALSEAAWLPDVVAYRAALPSVSVLMTEAGQGFDASDKVARQVELLRLALLHGREVVKENAVADLLKEEQVNPMQVILTAHSLLGQGKLDVSQLSAVVKRLPSDFAEYPDIQALALDQPAEMRAVFPTPPMLRSSWDRILQALEQRKVIVPPGSLTAQIAGGVIKTSLWLVHRLDSQEV
ncbi:MAG: hypothetical protein SD837_22415 [Candidatus Electrothrix scaldis]|nr:MAG: hypothetical protein SD837_22415 [Candidatus Electrothrix sp. GW3-3]